MGCVYNPNRSLASLTDIVRFSGRGAGIIAKV